MKKIAVLIGVETYSDAEMPTAEYAANDARAMGEALALHGFDVADQLLLVEGQATKTLIEARLRRTFKSLGDYDTLYVYYAGRAFARDGQSFLTSHDTLASDLEDTSIALEPILLELERAKCRQAVLLLDCRALTSPAGGATENLLEHEIIGVLKDAEHCLCFAACGSDETSYPSHAHKHGIWTYSLLEAFTGNAPLALEKGLLTAERLQSHLTTEVPRLLRSAYAGASHQQTPWAAGDTTSTVLVDMRPVLLARKEAGATPSDLVTALSFVTRKRQPIKSLSGFRKGQRMPDRADDRANAYIGTLAVGELKDDLDTKYNALKKAYKFTRRQLDASDPTEGAGSIITPYFKYSVSVALDPEDLSEVVWTRSVYDVTDPSQVMSPAFGQVFDGTFSTLDFVLPTAINLEDFIDTLEAAATPGLRLEYDRELTHVDLRLQGNTGVVRITPQGMAVVHDHPQPTATLIQSFDTVRLLVGEHNVPLISFRPGE